jgi:hypothetical protein
LTWLAAAFALLNAVKPNSQGVTETVRRLILSSVFLLSAVLATGAQADAFSVATSVTARDVPAGVVAPGTRVVVAGRISSARSACEGGKLVKLFVRRPGADRVVATDRTDRDGEFSFALRPNADLVVYARFGGSHVSSYGHRHLCRGDSSAALRIDVRGR